jgi:hypothetical protein
MERIAMLPLFDLMMQAQNGTALEAMSKQFGLAQEQMKAAMAALVPAFSTGLKRTAADPYDFGALMAAAASGNYAQYFEDMTRAFTPQGVADGNNALNRIFGSPDVASAIAAQAAQMSGVGQEVMKKMMPAMANTMMGGFLRQMADQFESAGRNMTGGAMPNFFEQWMQATGMKGKPAAPSPFDNPFTQSLQAFFQQSKPAQDASNVFANNPFAQMFASMMASGSDKKDAPPPKKEGAVDQDGVSTLINQMFDSGIEVQKNYQKAMDGVFDTYLANFKAAEKSDKDV